MRLALEAGDTFEKEKCEWIRENFPCYEEVWAEFIGHDGSGTPLKFSNLSEESEGRRATFMQSHYSAIVTCYFLLEEVRALLGSYGKISSPDCVLRSLKELTTCMAFVGNVHDMMGRIDAALKLHNSLATHFRWFFEVRNVILHGPRIPFRIHGQEILIPVPSEVWDDKASWRSLGGQGFVLLQGFCETTQQRLFQTINANYGQILGGCKKEFGQGLLLMPALSSIPVRPHGPSGSTVSYGFSGQYV